MHILESFLKTAADYTGNQSPGKGMWNQHKSQTKMLNLHLKAASWEANGERSSRKLGTPIFFCFFFSPKGIFKGACGPLPSHYWQAPVTGCGKTLGHNVTRRELHVPGVLTGVGDGALNECTHLALQGITSLGRLTAVALPSYQGSDCANILGTACMPEHPLPGGRLEVA